MAEKIRENYLVKETVSGKEKVDIQEIPYITQWSNGATPEPTIHRVILPSPNGNQPLQNEARFTEVNYENLITEDDEPVDNIPSEKQQRLLSETLYSSGHLPEPFLVTANVGLFDEPSVPPVVPDVLVSLGVKTGEDLLKKENRSYFVWKEGKPPEVVLEIVSNNEGNETGSKFERYAAMGVKYYAILDHGHYVQEETLAVYELEHHSYVARNDYRLPELSLALTFWDGVYEQSSWPWIRWCTLDGDLFLTGQEKSVLADERAEQEKQRAKEAEEQVEQERLRAEQEQLRAKEAEVQVEQERLRAEQEQLRAKEAEDKLAEQVQLAALYLAKLREAGIEIDGLG